MAQIAVIGLGIVGLSIAHRLATAGHKVTGFEQFSSLHDQGSSHGDTRIFRLTPRAGEPYFSMSRRAESLWREMNARSAEALLQPGGHLDLILPGKDDEVWRRTYQDAAGAYREISHSEAAHLFDGRLLIPDGAMAFYQQDSFILHPDPIRRFLWQEACRHGAVLHDHVRVNALDAAGKTVATAQGSVTYDAIIISAGAWLSELCPFVTTATAERKTLGWFHRDHHLPTLHWPSLIAFYGDGVYGMPTPDGGYKFGLDTVGDRLQPPFAAAPFDAADAQRLAEAGHGLVDGLDPLPYRGATCLYTLLPQDDFLIDRHPEQDDVLIFSCCSGHGFKYAPVYGEIALHMVEGRDTPFPLQRFALKKATAKSDGTRQDFSV